MARQSSAVMTETASIDTPTAPAKKRSVKPKTSAEDRARAKAVQAATKKKERIAALKAELKAATIDAKNKKAEVQAAKKDLNLVVKSHAAELKPLHRALAAADKALAKADKRGAALKEKLAAATNA